MTLSRNQIQILSLISVSMLAHITLGGGRVAASLYMLQNGGSEALAGIAYSGYCLLPAILSLLMGRWVDRVGTRQVMRASLMIMVVGLVVPALWPSMATILFSSAVCGFGFASYMLAANVAVSMMPVAHDGERVGMLGWLAMGNSVAAVGGPAITGLTIDHGGFASAYGLMALIVSGGLVASYLVDVPGAGAPRARQKGEGSVVKLVFGNPRILRIYLLAMCTSMLYDGFSFMTPVLGHERGFSATTIGMIMSAFAVGTFAVRAVLPWLSRRLPEWRMLTLAFGFAATAFLLLPLAADSLMHAALGFVFGLSAGASQPNIFSLIYRAMPEGKAGEGAGLRSMMGNAVGLTAPSLYGAVSALSGAAPVFIGIGCIAALASWQSDRGLRAARATAPAAP
ncbi:MAG: MFS transporter [Candidatus Dactylopiibacterium sp.]|nr:MFS transporter [Candidatus Dactylopiibacterium sp.]